jgi:arsenate reductase-like glutaredoxin family protein
MKLILVFNVAVVASATAALFSSEVFESWDINDLRDYLKDKSIPFDEKKATISELKDLSHKQLQLDRSPPWYSPQNVKQKVLSYWDSSPPKFYDTDYSNLKDWVFSTWSEADLKKLLKKTGVKFSASDNRSALQKLAQENYDAIAKSLNASGKYPGDWLYSCWDKKDLKKWLKKYDIDYSSMRDSKNDLVRKVRENAYKASLYACDERDNLLDSLDLSSQSLFDKAGEIKEDVFGGWSASQLYNWLKSHEVEFEESVRHNQKELRGIANKHKDELKDDIDYWVSKARQKASPILEKGSKKADEVINDTFLVGVNGWSKARLKSFLEARDISIPLLATKYDLVKLVKENKWKPIRKFNTEGFFDGWSKKNVQKWLEAQGETAHKGSKDLANRANDAYKSFVDSAVEYAKAAQEKVKEATGIGKPKSAKDAFFDTWSDVELKKYLGTFGVKDTKSTKRTDLLELAKKNTRWFVTGDSSNGHSAISCSKLAIANAVNNAVDYYKSVVNWLYYKLF